LSSTWSASNLENGCNLFCFIVIIIIIIVFIFFLILFIVKIFVVEAFIAYKEQFDKGGIANLGVIMDFVDICGTR
jgi:hypothetical protein